MLMPAAVSTDLAGLDDDGDSSAARASPIELASSPLAVWKPRETRTVTAGFTSAQGLLENARHVIKRI
jgi:hypothetical protein